MNKDSDKMPEIKLGGINFSDQESILDTELGFKRSSEDSDGKIQNGDDEYNINTWSSEDYNTGNTISFDSNSENQQDINFLNDDKISQKADDVVRVDFDKLDTNKTKKYTLWGAIMFLIVVSPIMYHNLKDYYQTMKQAPISQELNVEVKRFNRVPIYSSSQATGLITPESSVDVVARVDGYLQETYFKEGDFIQKGQLLFKIEPEEYKIAVREAEATVEQANAVYMNSLQELERAKELIKENFISRSDYDGIVATANQSKASLDGVKQSLARARLNLNYTQIYAPIAGKAGKISLSNGNYVGLSFGPLVKIVKTNPVCVSFSMKSAEVIKLKQANKGVFDLSNAKVELILSNNTKYNKIGKINFSDNNVAEDAASLSLKAVFDNPENILVPGDYVKVIITSATPVAEFLIPQSITRGDALNGYYLWAVKDGVTKKLPVNVIGSRENNWIIDSGISENDDIIVKSNLMIDLENTPANIETK